MRTPIVGQRDRVEAELNGHSTLFELAEPEINAIARSKTQINLDKFI